MKNDYIITSNKLVSYAGKEKEIQIPDGVEEILEYAFGSLCSAERIIITKSVKNIHPNAFSNRTLKEIIVDPSNPYFIAENGILYSKDKSLLITYPNERAGKYFDIPNGVKRIYGGAFDYNGYLNRISIPASVETIDNDAFGLLANLDKIILNVENTHFKVVDDILFDYSMKILIKCPVLNKLNKYTVPSSVNRICTNSFSFNDSLTEIHLPEGLKVIEAYAFCGCPHLVKVEFPDELEKIGDRAFEFCQNLKEVNVPACLMEIGEGIFDETKVKKDIIKEFDLVVKVNVRGLGKVKRPSNPNPISSDTYIGINSDNKGENKKLIWGIILAILLIAGGFLYDNLDKVVSFFK